ncbi:MAG TPA: energy transducer TonB, partial [Terriglobia bacterium]|nr:energy transducer TonB [Terriglobia bacterium]
GPSRLRVFLENLKVVLGIGQPELPKPSPTADPEFTYMESSSSGSSEFMENLKVVQEDEPAAAEPGSTEGLEVPFGVLTSSGESSFLENLKAVLGIGQHVSTELTSTADPEAPYNELSPRRPAGRGLLYSFLLHEIAIFALLIIPPALRPERKFYYVEEWKPLFTKLTYSLPAIGGGRSGGGQKGGGGKPGGGSTGNSESAPKKAAAPAAAPRGSGGLVYPAPQAVVSNPPNPTNRIQTILQPELVKPPTLKAPLPLPNIVTVARPKLPAPPPLAPKVEPLRTVRPSEQEAPNPSTDGRAAMHAPAWPFSVPPPPAAPPPVAPKLTLPPAQPEDLPVPTPAPPKPFEAKAPAIPTGTSVPSEAPRLPAPSRQVTGMDDRSLLVLSPTPGPPEEAPKVPPGEARGQFAMGPESNMTASGGFGPGAENGGVPTPGSAAGSESGVPGGVGATGEGSGPGGVPGGGPGGEGAGSGSGSGGGVGNGIGAGIRQLTDSGGTGAGGSGSGGGLGSGVGTGTGPGRGEGIGSGTGTGSGFGSGPGRGSGTGTGSGVGAGSGSGSGPFPGISIMGGSGTTGTATHTGSQPHSLPGKRPTYGLTITSTAASGGGLRDYGIFSNESVYTVYVEMTHSPTLAPSWTLQYSVLPKPNSSSAQPAKSGASLWSDQNVLAPYPIDKENPEFPVDAVSRNLGRMVVVYGEINTEGKLEKMRIIQSPNPLLDAPLLAALAKWTFRPAELNGEPVAVKALLGVPLSLPE